MGRGNHMAEWIAWQKGLAAKPEVVAIAGRLGVTRREAAAMCCEVWEWADSNTADGFVEGMTAAHLSDVVNLRGIGEAMAAFGWLLEDPGGLHFPNFDRWNGATAKKRLQDAKRQARKRRMDGEDGIGARRRRLSR